MLDFDDALKASTERLTAFVASKDYSDMRRYCSPYHSMDSNSFAFVGGFFYRRILEEYHNRPFGAEHCDIDILFLTKGHKKPKPAPVGTITSGFAFNNLQAATLMPTPTYKKPKNIVASPTDDEFYTSCHLNAPNGRKIDLIYIGDMVNVSENATIKEFIEAYWSRVPFHIQQVAGVLDPVKNMMQFMCSYEAKESIINCDLSINSKETLKDYCELKGFELKQYVAEKKRSLRFNRSKMAQFA